MMTTTAVTTERAVTRPGPGVTPRIRTGSPADREALAALLAGLSPESSYLRFQTGIGPVPPRAIIDAMLPARAAAGALLAFVGDRLVGHGMWVRPGAAPVAEIGLVVADDHQARGIGSALAAALVAELAARGIERAEVFSGAGNQAVARMLDRNAPGAVRVVDGATVSYSFPVPAADARSVVPAVA